MTKHVLNRTGQGHFSRGSCTGCEWALKGHADEIDRVWAKYHEGDQVQEIPQRVALPAMTNNSAVDAVEMLLIARLAAAIVYDDPNSRLIALGAAQARSAVLSGTNDGTYDSAVDYVADMTARIAHISQRQRAKLISPTITRQQQQAILEAE